MYSHNSCSCDIALSYDGNICFDICYEIVCFTKTDAMQL